MTENNSTNLNEKPLFSLRSPIHINTDLPDTPILRLPSCTNSNFLAPDDFFEHRSIISPSIFSANKFHSNPPDSAFSQYNKHQQNNSLLMSSTHKTPVIFEEESEVIVIASSDNVGSENISNPGIMQSARKLFEDNVFEENKKKAEWASKEISQEHREKIISKLKRIRAKRKLLLGESSETKSTEIKKQNSFSKRIKSYMNRFKYKLKSIGTKIVKLDEFEGGLIQEFFTVEKNEPQVYY